MLSGNNITMDIRSYFSTILCSFCMIILFSLHLNAQGDHTEIEAPLAPTVFVLGQYQESYEALSAKFESSLLTACNNDLQEAYKKWMHMMSAMEAYSNQIDYDIRGLKIWLQVYWNPDGSLAHVAYHLKPNSRNFDYAELNAFFKSFSNHYELPLKSPVPYAHYGSASFPLYIGSRRLHKD